jgi:hypothetical protein
VHWNGRYLTKNPAQKPPPRRGLHGAATGWRLTLGGGEGALERAGSPSLPGTNDFWAFGPDDVWAIEGDGLRHFNGRAWTPTESPLPHAAAARSPTDLWVAVDAFALDHHQLWHFDGTRWSASSVLRGDREALVALAAPVGGDVWLLTTSRLRRYDGRSWTTVKTPDKVTLRTLLVRSNDDVWVGADKALVHWDGKAVTNHTTTVDVRQLWWQGNELWAAPPAQRWNGSAFVPVPELNTAELNSAQVAPAGDVLWLTAGDKLARWQGGKVELIPVNQGELTAIQVGTAGDLWLAAQWKILHGQAGALQRFQRQDSVGLEAPFALGGGGGLVWAIGPNGLILRHEP